MTPEAISEILAFTAPYLIEKLLKEHIVATEEEGEALFTEVKRYLVLCRVRDAQTWSMSSLRVDEVWHQFVLFTGEYVSFSKRFFGHYQHHAPSNAPVAPGIVEKAEGSAEDFAAAYEELFGVPVPDLWRDDLAVTVNRRLVNYAAQQVAVRVAGERAELIDPRGDEARVILRVDALAEAALAFIARTGTFFVRELPGPLEDAEREELCAVLVRQGVLRVAS